MRLFIFNKSKIMMSFLVSLIVLNPFFVTYSIEYSQIKHTDFNGEAINHELHKKRVMVYYANDSQDEENELTQAVTKEVDSLKCSHVDHNWIIFRNYYVLNGYRVCRGGILTVLEKFKPNVREHLIDIQKALVRGEKEIDVFPDQENKLILENTCQDHNTCHQYSHYPTIHGSYYAIFERIVGKIFPPQKYFIISEHIKSHSIPKHLLSIGDSAFSLGRGFGSSTSATILSEEKKVEALSFSEYKKIIKYLGLNFKLKRYFTFFDACYTQIESLEDLNPWNFYYYSATQMLTYRYSIYDKHSSLFDLYFFILTLFKIFQKHSTLGLTL